MTEDVPVVPSMPECNGSVVPEKGPLQVIGIIDDIARSVGTGPYTNADTSPDAPLAKGNQEESRNSLVEDSVCGDFDGEKQREEKQEENDATLQQGSVDLQDTGTGGQESEEGPGGGQPALGTAAGPSGEVAGTPAGTAEQRGNDAEEEEEEEVEEEEEDTEEDEVQVIEMRETSEASRRQQQESGKEVSPPTSPGCNAQAEKAGEQPSLGKKNDISRHSYSRYNTISYRKIRKGNTKQRIDEFESMMHL
uniref:Ermin n=1 Tax=Anser cygnoides TaxID=8845 RepID=A0A8B9DDK3_ANSCY|nr:ermin [Anser cygnoides]